MPRHRMRRASIVALVIVSIVVAATGPASAHPHVWVTMDGQLVYSPDGLLPGVRYDWTFDDEYSAFAIQGIQAKKRGELTREELVPLAALNIRSLKDFGYFTFGKVNGKKIELKEPTDYYLDYDSKETTLTLHFTLPFRIPIKAKDLNLEIYDPEYFVAFSFKETKNPVALVGAPTGCKLSIQRPHDLVVPAGQTLSEAFFSQLTAADNWGAQFANKLSVKCP